MKKIDMDLKSLKDFISIIHPVDRSSISAQINQNSIDVRRFAHVSEETKMILDGSQEEYIKLGGDKEGFQDEVKNILIELD